MQEKKKISRRKNGILMFQLEDRTFYSSPDEDTEQPFLDFIGSATSSVHIADYSFNMKNLVPLLVSLFEKCIEIELTLDKSQSGGSTEEPEIQQLRDAGIQIVIGTSDKHKIMHLKVVVVDGNKSLYGSWNFTDAATQEDNFYVIDENPRVALYFDNIIEKVRNWILQNQN